MGIRKKIGIKFFEYIYVFVMVIYMAQMNDDTSRMYGGLSGNPIPFLIPIIMTLVLLKRNSISFRNKKLSFVLFIITIWAILFLIKLGTVNSGELSYLFFLYYAIIIAYIHIKVYGNKIFFLYEDILVLFSKISLFLWCFAVVLPNLSSSFFHLFPETGYGNNFIYIFNWMDPAKGQVSLFLRNAGCSWEPGRFAIMIVLAILCNLSQHGIRFKSNKNIIYLLLALLTTQSTTGLVVAIMLYVIFYFKRFTLNYIFGFIFILIPLIISILSFDFMGKKIYNQWDVESQLDNYIISAERINKTLNDGEYAFSMNRFPAMVMEWQNVINDPILGYGRNIDNSYFYKKISTNIVLTGGLVKILGQYGILLGLFLYYILYKSSISFAYDTNVKRKYALFFSILLFNISYITFCVPIFTTFWFYGYFKEK